MKYRLIYTLALLMALPLVAQAQKLHQWRVPGQTDTREAAPDGLRKLHITDKIANSPEGRQALADFHRRKALGLLPRAAKSTDALGDQHLPVRPGQQQRAADQSADQQSDTTAGA